MWILPVQRYIHTHTDFPADYCNPRRLGLIIAVSTDTQTGHQSSSAPHTTTLHALCGPTLITRTNDRCQVHGFNLSNTVTFWALNIGSTLNQYLLMRIWSCLILPIKQCFVPFHLLMLSPLDILDKVCLMVGQVCP